MRRLWSAMTSPAAPSPKTSSASATSPQYSGGVEVEIVGRLTALLGEKAYPNSVRGVWGKMVAEERYRHCRAATRFAC